MNDVSFLLVGPNVSKASGMNIWVFSNSWYFYSFLSAAPSAATPGVADVMGRQHAASVSVTVTS